MKMHRVLLCCAALSGIVDAPHASAQPQAVASPMMHVVRLLDGSIYQGELVELVPNDHLTLRLASGEIKRFAWNEMLPPNVAAPTPAQPVPGVTIVTGTPGLVSGFPLTINRQPVEPPDPVNLHFDATDPAAVLFAARDPTGLRFNGPNAGLYGILQDWTMVCPRAPCDVRADRRQIYSVQGPYIIRSLPFTLPAGNSVTADARVTHTGVRTLLTTMVVLGGVAMSASFAMFIYGGVQDTTALGGGAMELQMAQDAMSHQHTAYIAGGVLAGVGAAMLISGLIANAYARTTINFSSDGREVALRLPGKAKLDLTTMQVHF